MRVQKIDILTINCYNYLIIHKHMYKNKNKRTKNAYKILPLYTICNSSVVFTHNFNEPLDNYYHIIIKYPSLIFDKNPPLFISPSKLSTNNSCFNMPIDLTNNLKDVVMSNMFNQSIFLTKRLVKIRFGYEFDQFIILSKNLVEICLGHKFNQMISLAKKIKILWFGDQFNKPLILSKKLVCIKTGLNFNQSFNVPKNCVKLFLSSSFNQPIILPRLLKNLEISRYYEHHLVIESKITHLTIRRWERQPCAVKILDNLPNKLLKCVNITKIKYEKRLVYNLPNDIKSSGLGGLYYTTRRKYHCVE